MHIIPLPQAMGTLGTGLTIAIIITTTIELTLRRLAAVEPLNR